MLQFVAPACGIDFGTQTECYCHVYHRSYVIVAGDCSHSHFPSIQLTDEKTKNIILKKLLKIITIFIITIFRSVSHTVVG